MALLRKLLPLLCAILIAPPGHAQAPTPASREYAIKAAFLFNFAQFVEWPTNVFAEADSPFVIGVLGANPFGKSLEEIVRGESIRGHPVQVRYLRADEPIADCTALFISQSENARLEAILQSLERKPVLTVSDVERFARRGGMIRFVNQQNKIRFTINPEAAKNAGLSLSSKLLRLGEIVRTGDP